MRKFVFFMLAAMLLTSCEKSLVNDDEVEKNPSVSTTDGKRFTFTVKGDFTDEWKPVTRGYLQADGKDMTNLWVLDYMGDELQQQIDEEIQKELEAEVKRLSKDNLAEYKTPTMVVLHREPLPKTSTQKVKRKDLLAWYEGVNV